MNNSYKYKIKEYYLDCILGNYSFNKIIKINKRFMIFNRGMNEISIYGFQTKSILDKCIKSEKIIFYFDFHCNNEMILFVCAKKRY